MIGTDELEVRRLVHGLDVGTFAQRAAVAATRAQQGRLDRAEDDATLDRVRAIIGYVLAPVPSAPKEQAAHALIAQPGTEEVLRAAQSMPDGGRYRLEQMKRTVERVLGHEELSKDDEDHLKAVRALFLNIGRMNLRQATAARLEREARPGGVA